MLTDFAIWGDGNTPPNKSYVRNATDIFSGNVDNPWTRPYMVFVPDRLTKYLGVGATVYSPALAVAGSTQLNSQYFTKWMLEPTEVAPTERITPSAAYSKAREVQITVKPDRVNLLVGGGFEATTGVVNDVIRRNNIANPRPANATGYTLANNATITYDAVKLGINTSVLAGGSVDSGVNVGGSNITGGVVSGETWTFAAEVEAITAVDLRMSVQGTTVPASVYGSSLSLAAGATGRVTVTASFTSTGAAQVYVLRAAGTSAMQFVVRKVIGTKTSYPVDYFDGGQKTGKWNSNDFNTQWSGTVDNSPSDVRASKSVKFATASTNAVAVQSTDWADSGTYSLRIVPAQFGGTDSYAYFGGVVDGGALDLFANGYLAEGKTYTVRAIARQTSVISGATQAADQQRNIYLSISGAGGGQRKLAASVPHANAAGTYSHTLTFTIPKVAGDPVTLLQLRLYNGHTGGSEHIWWDSVIIEEGEVIKGLYFDGSTSTDHVWRSGGTPHETISFYYRNRVDRLNAMNVALRDTVPMGIGVGSPRFGIWPT